MATNVFGAFGSPQGSASSFSSLPSPAWPTSGFGMFGQQNTTPVQPATPPPTLSFNQPQQQPQQQDKGQIIQCLTESKNVQLAILNELKQMNERMVAKPAQPVPPTQSNTVHMGVFCNRCMKNNITGVRYKCMFCKDFDMCDQCEQQQGSHDPSHFMIKIKDSTAFNNVMSQKPAFFSV